MLNTTQPLGRTIPGATDTITVNDLGTLINYTSSGAVAVSLPAASTTGFESGKTLAFNAKGTGTVTVTPVSGTINGAATLVIPPHTGCYAISDGANWQVDLSSCTSIASVPGTGTVNPALQYQLGVFLTAGSAISGSSAIVTDASNDLSVAGIYQIGGSQALAFKLSDTGTAGSTIAIGPGALANLSASAAFQNTAVGYQSMNGVMTATATRNSALGYQSLQKDTTGNGNTAVGYQAMNNNTTGSNNTSVGLFAGIMNAGCATCSGNTAIGANAMLTALSSGSVAVGYNAGLHGANANSGNVSIGMNAQTNYLDFGGNNNIAIGNGAGHITGGGSNIEIGPFVGSTTLTTGSRNILIGTSSSTDTVASGDSDKIIIGDMLYLNHNSTAAPAVTSCGTSPTIDSHANNHSGTVTVGSGTATSCTVTLAGTGYSTWNHCRVTPHSTLAAFAYSYTTTVLTVTGTSLTSALFDYACEGY